MTPQQLREIIAPVKNAINELGNPSANEKRAIRIARYSIVLSVLSIGLVVWQILDSPNSKQFSLLLEKQSKLYSKDSLLAEVQIDYYNLNAEITNQNKKDLLNKKFNRYNEITFALSDVEEYVYWFKAFRERKRGHLAVLSVNDRLNLIREIFARLKGMTDIEELIPNHKLGAAYDKCITSMLRAQMIYTDGRAYAGTVDSSYEGQKAFNELMFSVLDFQDKVLEHIAEGRDKTDREIKSLDTVIDVNNKVMIANAHKRDSLIKLHK